MWNVAEKRLQPAAPPLSRRIAAGVATRGRPDHVRRIVALLRRQILRPAVILVAYVEPADVAGLSNAVDLALIACAPGLTRQRNAILDALPHEAEFVAFFDDDFLPHPQWLHLAVAAFDADPALAGLTGQVLANGVCGGEIAPSLAREILTSADPAAHQGVEPEVSPYGCNMAFRCAAVGRLRFDERLVLYGWLEDRDFAARVGGRMARVNAALGVHLGVGAGRMSDRRLGYAQIANPLYLLRRRTMSAGDCARRVGCDLASNLAKALRSHARRKRLAGNLLALGEALVGRCKPERAARF